MKTIWLLPLGVVLACGEPTTSTVRRFAVLDDVCRSNWLTVSAGADHTCALKTDASAYCWGSNHYGQLGTQRVDTACGATDNRYACVPVPAPVEGSVHFRSISAGNTHSCGIGDTGDAYCWGSNAEGQLGDLFARGGSTLTRVPSNVGWMQLSAGHTHTCGIRTDGLLFCWGANDRGQIGNGGAGSSLGVTRVQIPGPVGSVSAGMQRTCARTVVGAVYCWGAVWFKHEGDIDYTRTQPSPQLVPQSPAMTRLSVGSLTTCGADSSGFAYCWEANTRGEMGTGDSEGSTTPRRIASDLEFLQISAGLLQTCGVVAGGAGYCWGDDSFGQLGVSPFLLAERCGGQQLPCSTVPTPVFGRQLFTAVSTGFGSHTCGVTTLGNLYCWGLGVSGQRGDGTIANASSVPVKVVEP